MSQQYRIQELDLALIVFDEELQVRLETDQETVREYYEAMATEEDVKRFPPITVYFDGHRYWLADGHHRYWAVKQRGYGTITVKVIDGSHDDALLAAVKLNAQNGLRFKDGDWEKIIPLIVCKSQWQNWSNRTLALELGCAESTIRKYRPTHSGAHACAPEKRLGKDGKLYPVKMKKLKTVATKPEQTETTVTESKKPINQSPETEPIVTKTENEAADTSILPSESNSEMEKVEETRSTDRHRIEANVKETQILATISQLQIQIAEWFEIAPDDMREGFDKRLRKRIGELID